MRYFLDTEFIEGFHKPMFGKKRHFIDLVSIGIVCEDGREYYAISQEFNVKDADEWVRENVIDKLQHHHPPAIDGVTGNDIVSPWKYNRIIAEEICMFCYPNNAWQFRNAKTEFLSRAKEYGWIADQPEFYGYYSDYDWVLFCSLFGRMIDLPKGFPMYCKDLKQMLDEKISKTTLDYYGVELVNANTSLESKLKAIKLSTLWPQQKDEHNALSDAKWNKELYDFLNKP